MSTLAEIEEAIVRLPEGQVDKLASWLEQRRANRGKTSTSLSSVSTSEAAEVDRDVPIAIC